MTIDRVHPAGSVFARLSRFALCIAPTSGLAYDALQHVVLVNADRSDASIDEAFRLLLDHLERHQDREIEFSGSAGHSIVARFSRLSYHQRVAFALVVIEEFTVPQAGDIMGLSEDDVRQLLLATRDFLFSGPWAGRGDA